MNSYERYVEATNGENASTYCEEDMHMNVSENYFRSRINDVHGWLTGNKTTVVSSFLAGLIINCGVFVYQIGNGDTVKWSIYQEDFSWERAQGRWLLEGISYFRNYKVIPLFISILSLIYISFAVAFIVDALNIRNRFFILALSILYMASPFMNSYLYIYYTSDAYCLGVLIATIAGWIYIKKRNIKYLSAASILVMLSLAIYQATINIIAALCCIGIFLRALDNKITIRKQLSDIFKIFISGIVGLILYGVSLKLCFAIRGGTLAAYKGFNDIGHYTLKIFVGMFKTYVRYLGLLYFEKNDYVSSSLYYSNAINGMVINAGILFIIVLIVICCAKHNQYRRMNVVWLVGTAILLLFGWAPVIFASSAFASDNAYLGMVNSLISPQAALLYGLCFCLCERIGFIKYSLQIKVIALCLSVGMCFNYTLAINEAYYGNQLAFYQAEALTLRIIDRMEQTDGWHEGMEVAFYGGLNGNISNNYPTANTKIRYANMPFMWDGQTQIGWIKYLREYFGLEYIACSNEFFNNLKNNDDFKAMDSFPASNSVRVIDGVMVVKLSSD